MRASISGAMRKGRSGDESWLQSNNAATPEIRHVTSETHIPSTPRSTSATTETPELTLPRAAMRPVKVAFDVLMAAILFLAALPVFAIIWLLVRWDGGPGFYGHLRIGKHGVPFHCLKFRTMTVNSDQALADHLASNPAAAIEWSATRKLENDPRITPIGRFLRRTSLDEIPQLLNVLRTDMSLVGPRPVVEDELRYYGPNAGYYQAVRPGITGLWQISGRSDTSYEERVALDTRYVREWSFRRDLVILAQTLPAVLLQKGAK
ncbi:sugar transferase [Acetobacter fallax]|nr:sugar transferase [Acetobacter fallax]